MTKAFNRRLIETLLVLLRCSLELNLLHPQWSKALALVKDTKKRTQTNKVGEVFKNRVVEVSSVQYRGPQGSHDDAFRDYWTMITSIIYAIFILVSAIVVYMIDIFVFREGSSTKKLHLSEVPGEKLCYDNISYILSVTDFKDDFFPRLSIIGPLGYACLQ